jgi:hypothetical protein
LAHPSAESKHKPANGNDAYYNCDSTVMSYNKSQNPTPVHGLGPFDVLALQSLYGAAPGKTVAIDGKTLPQKSVIYSEKRMTLDLTGILSAVGDAQINVDLTTPDFSRQITGFIKDGDKKMPVHARIVPGTEIEHVDASAIKFPVMLTGNMLPNKLTGGESHDMLTAIGGGDCLTGGGGINQFCFDEKSGIKNIITDYSRGSIASSLVMGGQDVRVLAQYREHFRLQDKEVPGTLVWLQDKQEKTVASVFVINSRPQEINFTAPVTEKPIQPQVLASEGATRENGDLLPSPRTPKISAASKPLAK